MSSAFILGFVGFNLVQRAHRGGEFARVCRTSRDRNPIEERAHTSQFVHRHKCVTVGDGTPAPVQVWRLWPDKPRALGIISGARHVRTSHDAVRDLLRVEGLAVEE